MQEQQVLELLQSTRAGNILTTSKEEFPQHYPELDIEHDPEEIWSAASTLKNVSREIEEMGFDISAIGITNQRETSIIWDPVSGKPLQNGIVWQDRRQLNVVKS